MLYMKLYKTFEGGILTVVSGLKRDLRELWGGKKGI